MESNPTSREESSRRTFLKTSGLGATAVALAGVVQPLFAEAKSSSLTFPPLPYAENSLEPYISSRTLSIHHDKHHRRFMEEVIARVKKTDYKNASLEKIILETYGGINMIETLHLMALLSWNHEFYWNSMKPKGGGDVPPAFKKEIEKSFGSIAAFKTKFKEAAMTMGSGWAWLVEEKGKLLVTYTAYHDTPLLKKQRPLLTIDCWEHAYYLDYQNRKGEYIDAYLNHLVNWQFAESNLAATTTPAK